MEGKVKGGDYMSFEQTLLQKLVRQMLKNARRHQRKRARQSFNDYERGAVNAYYEMLKSLRNTLETFGQDFRAYELDVDLDEELLSLRRARRQGPRRSIRDVAGAWKEHQQEVREELKEILGREW
ncbi:hypothetical protein [Alicyclobacillus acidocaldarius]|uniref:Uncharacterized protein n=1 Tax=Alicyclobacillus acidocaldarius subsp. acidocaldarius (strain ATCC 27009 / DSM 446 / BCRC 14685 / JCM 5260 / KCTC 1825 / NBRC 15652 / NCIMB 11725 / NRRL B-14509 / 104-IA) TaxID=521098 RepID=C8WST5_ALIAD|nr:hypothetical protein [Alicyclobacillus acidocaldarius]ACV57591.1 hypothetical protein Aaci_0540 [Alicyclobacillus acidocaldarius subsp. acidocaldarius DSM 446]